MIYISIGSNIGNRLSHLQRATELLKKRYLKDLKSSIILETKAILPNGAPPDWNKPFLNMIVYGSCSSSSSEELLKGLKQIECDIGRPQVYGKWAPRVIDLDILLWDDLTLDIPDLKLPHPESVNRPFLLHLMAMVNKTFTFNVQDCFSKSFTLSPKLMGIINITPDSFSDGGLYYDANRATKQALQLVSDCASITTIGAPCRADK